MGDSGSQGRGVTDTESNLFSRDCGELAPCPPPREGRARLDACRAPQEGRAALGCRPLPGKGPTALLGAPPGGWGSRGDKLPAGSWAGAWAVSPRSAPWSTAGSSASLQPERCRGSAAAGPEPLGMCLHTRLPPGSCPSQGLPDTPSPARGRKTRVGSAPATPGSPRPHGHCGPRTAVIPEPPPSKLRFSNTRLIFRGFFFFVLWPLIPFFITCICEAPTDFGVFSTLKKIKTNF